MIDRAEAVRLFERRRDAWLAEDLDGYIGLFTEDLVIQTPMGDAIHGREAYAALVRGSLHAVRPVSFDFHQIACHDSIVLAEWTIALEIRATGRQISYRGMSVCEIQEGRIKTWREYYDPSHLRPEVGKA